MFKFITQEIKFPYYFTQFHMKRKGFVQYRDRYPQKSHYGRSRNVDIRCLHETTSILFGINRASVHGWNLGKNTGDIKKLIPLLVEQVTRLAQQEEPVTMIGVESGGILSREVARRIPEHVRAVCCIGSPLVECQKIQSMPLIITGLGLIWML